MADLQKCLKIRTGNNSQVLYDASLMCRSLLLRRGVAYTVTRKRSVYVAGGRFFRITPPRHADFVISLFRFRFGLISTAIGWLRTPAGST